MPVRKTSGGSMKTLWPSNWTGMQRAKIMAVYQDHVQRFRNRPAKNISISQHNITIGTSDDWSNAAEISRNPAWVNVDGADYVWSSRDRNSEFAVISERFRLSQNRSIRRGSLLLAVDNYAVVLINGRIVTYDAPQAEQSFFNPGRTFNVRRYLRRGRNDIVIIAFNFGGPRSDSNPAGVAARLNIRLSD
jgi:hypothetical protein